MLQAKFSNDMRIWRNWQTRTVQVRVVAISWKFESSYPHQKSVSLSDTDFFIFFQKVVDRCKKGMYIITEVSNS